jgi:hypothetical protein
MPFVSEKQKRFMFAQHPDIAKRWVAESKREGKAPVQKSKKSHKKATRGRKRR